MQLATDSGKRGVPGIILCFRQQLRRLRGEFLVTFEPGAHTAWHTHLFGQVLIVTAGKQPARRVLAKYLANRRK